MTKGGNMSDKEKGKGKIELKNVDFQWGGTPEKKVESEVIVPDSGSTEKTIVDMVRNINDTGVEVGENVNEITKSRIEEQEELNGAIQSLAVGVHGSSPKTDRENTRDELSQALSNLQVPQELIDEQERRLKVEEHVEANHSKEEAEEAPVVEKKVKSLPSEDKESSSPLMTYGIPFLGVASLVALAIVIISMRKPNVPEPMQPLKPEVTQQKHGALEVIKSKVFSGNDSEQQVAMVDSHMVVKTEAKAAAPIADLNFDGDHNKVVETTDGSVVINDELKVTSNNPKEQVNIGSIVSVPGQTDVPAIQFVSANEKMPGVKDNLSINAIYPPAGSNSLSTISLAQWPNAAQLKEMSKDFVEIEKLFPKTLYKKQEAFDGKDLLTIYDKRSVAQERFVKQSQSCYFIPSEMGGNWQGVNYFLISYCFLNNQFIGVNMYTNAEADVMKKLETNIKKTPYYQISSVYKGNGYNLISIEQGNAYKILEDFRIQMLNNAVQKKS